MKIIKSKSFQMLLIELQITFILKTQFIDLKLNFYSNRPTTIQKLKHLFF